MPRSKAERSSTRNASKETSSFFEPADQHPFLTGTAGSVRNMIFLTSACERSRHKFPHRTKRQFCFGCFLSLKLPRFPPGHDPNRRRIGRTPLSGLEFGHSRVVGNSSITRRLTAPDRFESED